MNHILTPEDCIDTYETIVASQANCHGKKTLLLQVNINSKYINACFVINWKINNKEDFSSASTLKDAKEIYNSIVLE